MGPNNASASEDEVAENPLDRVLRLLQHVKKSALWPVFTGGRERSFVCG